MRKFHNMCPSAGTVWWRTVAGFSSCSLPAQSRETRWTQRPSLMSDRHRPQLRVQFSRSVPSRSSDQTARFPEAERMATAYVVIQYSLLCKIYKNSKKMWAVIFFLAVISQMECGLTSHVTTFVTFDWLPTNIKHNFEITKLQLK
jgi:hypothetical protein